MGTFTVRDRARSELARVAAARLDNDGFRREAAAVLRRAIGFDGWCWMLTDPGSQLPTRDLGENVIVDQAIRRFGRRHPEAWAVPRDPSVRPVTVMSAVTGGDLARNLLWRETFGPAGVGDHMHVPLIADGTCWAQLHIHRDSSGEFFSADDAELVAGVAPMLAARLRDGLRARPHDGEAAPPDDPAAEPGTFIVDEELSLVATTRAAWDWIDRLGLSRPNDTEPLPGFIYAAAARVALAGANGSDPLPSARARLQAADGSWVVVRVAPLTGAAGGYVITLETARSEDLVPLLMRVWSLTAREREVARLVIDGLSSDDIAAALFISVHTVRDHVKAIFGKTGVSRRRDLVAALAGTPPAPADRGR